MLVLLIEDICPSILRLMDDFDHFRAVVDHFARDGVVQAVLLLRHIQAILDLPDYDGRNALPGMVPAERIWFFRQNYIRERVVHIRRTNKSTARVVLWFTFLLDLFVLNHFCEVLVYVHDYGFTVNDELKLSIRSHVALNVEKLNICRPFVVSFVEGVGRIRRLSIVVEGPVTFKLKLDLVVLLILNRGVLECPFTDGHAQRVAVADHRISIVFVGGHIN